MEMRPPGAPISIAEQRYCCLMPIYSVPGVGDVVATIDVQEFFQADYKIRSLGRAHLVGGAALSADQYATVRTHLKASGIIDQ